MRVMMAVLADYAATTDEGKLVIGGVFETINTRALPATHPMMALALRISADPGEAGTHRLTLRLLDPDGTEVIPALDGDLSIREPNPGEGARAQVILNMPGITFTKAGMHSLDVSIDGRSEYSVELFVRVIPFAENGFSTKQQIH